jgi:hypothetical protein
VVLFVVLQVVEVEGGNGPAGWDWFVTEARQIEGVFDRSRNRTRWSRVLRRCTGTGLDLGRKPAPFQSQVLGCGFSAEGERGTAASRVRMQDTCSSGV